MIRIKLKIHIKIIDIHPTLFFLVIFDFEICIDIYVYHPLNAQPRNIISKGNSKALWNLMHTRVHLMEQPYGQRNEEERFLRERTRGYSTICWHPVQFGLTSVDPFFTNSRSFLFFRIQDRHCRQISIDEKEREREDEFLRTSFDHYLIDKQRRIF